RRPAQRRTPPHRCQSGKIPPDAQPRPDAVAGTGVAAAQQRVRSARPYHTRPRQCGAQERRSSHRRRRQPDGSADRARGQARGDVAASLRRRARLAWAPEDRRDAAAVLREDSMGKSLAACVALTLAVAAAPLAAEELPWCVKLDVFTRNCAFAKY